MLDAPDDNKSMLGVDADAAPIGLPTLSMQKRGIDIRQDVRSVPICRDQAQRKQPEDDFHHSFGNVARTMRLLIKHWRTLPRVLRHRGGSADATQ